MAKKNHEEKNEETSQYRSAPGFTVDEIGFIQLASAEVLLAAAKGQIDLNKIAREELASRGLGIMGRWVGFENARKAHGVER